MALKDGHPDLPWTASHQYQLHSNHSITQPRREISTTDLPGLIFELDMEDTDQQWRDTTDPRERRRAQNRINQRNYREKMRRRQEELERRLAQADTSSPARHSSPPEIPEISNSVQEYSEYLRQSSSADSGWSGELSFPISADLERSITAGPPRSRVSLSAWLQATQSQPSQGDEQFEFVALHMMIRLAKAARINLRPLELQAVEFANKSCLSPFLHQLCVQGRTRTGMDWNAWIGKIRQATPALAPTALQHTVEHHPFIDVLPFPGFRDGLLLAIHRRTISPSDLVELCFDIEEGGLRLWGNTSWEPTSFEVTDSFVQKWARRFDFGAEVIMSSNFWRSLRGEPNLTVPPVQHTRQSMPPQVRLRDLKIIRFLQDGP